MKLLNTGWQYKVYDLENGRVRKIQFSGVAHYKRILSQTEGFPHSLIVAYRRKKRVRELEISSNKYIRSILSQLDNELLGNPTFLNSSDYEQDKVTTVQEYLKSSNIEEAQRIIDDYIKNIFIFWSYGFSDAVFKIGNNNGVNSNNKVMQIDFGELVTEKTKAESLINEKIWLQEHIQKRLPEGEIRHYHNDTLSKLITVKKLDEVWGTQL